MRKLKQISLAAAIMLALSTGATAGIIECPPSPPPPTPSAAVTGIIDCPPATATGIISTPPSAQPAQEPTDPAVDLAFALLRSVLSVF